MPLLWAQTSTSLRLAIIPPSFPDERTFSLDASGVQIGFQPVGTPFQRRLPKLYAPLRLQQLYRKGVFHIAVFEKVQAGVLWPRLCERDSYFCFIQQQWDDDIPDESVFEQMLEEAGGTPDDGEALMSYTFEEEDAALPTCSAPLIQDKDMLSNPKVMQRNTTTRSTLKSMSCDTMLAVFSYLPVESIGSLAGVSACFRLACGLKTVWRNMCLRDRPNLCAKLSTVEDILVEEHLRSGKKYGTDKKEILRQWLERANMLECNPQKNATDGISDMLHWRQAYRFLSKAVSFAVTDQGNRRLKYIRCDGTHLKTVRCPVQTPVGICALRDGRIALTDLRGSKVFIMNLFGEIDINFPVECLPRGIIQLMDGTLLVCHMARGLVSIYTLEGKFVRTLGGEMCGPTSMIQLPDGTIVVSECNMSRLVFLRFEDGAVTRIIDGIHPSTGARHFQLNDPYDVALLPDKKTLALTDGGNNRILIITLEGVLIREIMCGFRHPEGVAAIPDSNMIVVCDTDNNRVCIVRWTDGVLVKSMGAAAPGSGPMQFQYPRCLTSVGFL